MNLSEIRKNLFRFPVLFVCGILLPVILAALILRAPKVNSYQQDIAELERRWKQMQTNVERSANFERELNRLIEGGEAIRSRLMNEEAVAANYEFFYQLEARSGLKVINFNIASPNDGSTMRARRGQLQQFQTMLVTLAMEGDLNQVLHFLDLLRSQAYIIHLEGLSLSRPVASPNPELLSADLRCYVLSRKSP